MLIVDAHLDLSFNAYRGRAVELPAIQQQGDAREIPTVGLPDLVAGGVKLICATIFCEPNSAEYPGYRTGDEAHAAAIKQLAWYQEQQAARRIYFIRRRDELTNLSHSLSAILLLEGADALRNEADVKAFFDAGLRIVGLAWRRTRLAGGTGEPGPLTPEGIALVKTLDQFSILHDVSHLAEQSFWDLLALTSGPVLASHSNCRSIVPTDRQLSDEMIRALIARGAVIGINFFDKFLLPPDVYGSRRASLKDLIPHIQHICDLAGDALHVGLGTDMDGGLGREQIPQEIQTSADLPLVGEALSAGGFSDEHIRGILGENWMRFFRERLPD